MPIRRQKVAIIVVPFVIAITLFRVNEVVEPYFLLSVAYETVEINYFQTEKERKVKTSYSQTFSHCKLKNDSRIHKPFQFFGGTWIWLGNT